MARLHPLAALGTLVLLALVAAACRHPREPYQIASPDPVTQRSTPSGDVVGGAGPLRLDDAWLGIPLRDAAHRQPSLARAAARGALVWYAPGALLWATLSAIHKPLRRRSRKARGTGGRGRLSHAQHLDAALRIWAGADGRRSASRRLVLDPRRRGARGATAKRSMQGGDLAPARAS